MSWQMVIETRKPSSLTHSSALMGHAAILSTPNQAEKSTERIVLSPNGQNFSRLLGCVQTLQRSTANTATPDKVPSIVQEALASPNQPLDSGTRAYMEPRFGHDFSKVRIHTDSKAAESAQSINALAYTLGNDLVFSRGRYAPGTLEGRQLLGHELTHVVQQSKTINAPMIQRAETDTAGRCPDTMADSAGVLNTQVNAELSAAASSLPHPIYPPDMVNAAFSRLGAPHNAFLAIIENWANNHLTTSGGGYLATAGTKYASVPLLQRGIFQYMAPAVKLGTHCVGTDKIGHMFQQGYQQFMVSSSITGLGGTVGAGMGDRYARAWSEWTEGVLSPATRADAALMTWLTAQAALPRDLYTGWARGHFGLSATGVHSRGDIAANDSGMRFYQALMANPGLTFDINNFIVTGWDEEVSGNVYSSSIGAAVTSAGRINPNDVVLP